MWEVVVNSWRETIYPTGKIALFFKKRKKSSTNQAVPEKQGFSCGFCIAYNSTRRLLRTAKFKFLSLDY